jgi:hypothetical protein
MKKETLIASGMQYHILLIWGIYIYTPCILRIEECFCQRQWTVFGGTVASLRTFLPLVLLTASPLSCLWHNYWTLTSVQESLCSR